MPSVVELKSQLKKLKKIHKEIRYTGLKKPQLEALVNKYKASGTKKETKVETKVEPVVDKKAVRKAERKENKKKGKAIIKDVFKKELLKKIILKGLAKRRESKRAVEYTPAEKVFFNPDLLRLIGGMKKGLEYSEELTFIAENLEGIIKLFEKFDEEESFHAYSKDDGNKKIIQFINWVLEFYATVDYKDIDKKVIDFSEVFFRLFLENLVHYEYGVEIDVNHFNIGGMNPMMRYSYGYGKTFNEGYIDETEIRFFVEMLKEIVTHIKDCLKDPKNFKHYIVLEEAIRESEYYSEMTIDLHQIKWLEKLFPKGKAEITDEMDDPSLSTEELKELGYGRDSDSDEDSDSDGNTDEWEPYKEQITFSLEK